MRHLLHKFQLIIPKFACILQCSLRICKVSVHNYAKIECFYRNKCSFILNRKVLEQKNLKERIPKAAERIEELQNSIANVTRFIDKAKRYTEINELSGELPNLFIEKIEIGERAERYSRTSEQKVIIHYRDIGVIGAFAEEAKKIAEQRQRQTA